MTTEKTGCAIVVSDLHCGCQFGLCPPNITLDGGGKYQQSAMQKVTWDWWSKHFWSEWVPEVTEHKPFTLVINGDLMDGVHHNSVSQISHNHADQFKIAERAIKTVLDKQPVKSLYIVRGTEVHAGQSSENEERLATILGAKSNTFGRYTRDELWLEVGNGLAHFLHHIGTSGSNAYEATALCKEYAEACTEAARWGYRLPDWVIRSHRHRHIEVRVPTKNGRGTAITTPGWQLKTPFTFKIAGARQTQPQMGGVAIIARHGELYTRSWVQSLKREKPEVCK